MNTLIYLAIIIIISIVSAIRNKNKQQQQGGSPSPTTSLEDEIRRMAERMMGKTEEPKPLERKPIETQRPVIADRQPSPYENYDEKPVTYKPLEQIPERQVENYSDRDRKSVEEQYERFKKPEYITNTVDYDVKYQEDLKKGRELHSIMDKHTTISVVTEKIEKHPLLEDFDARKAVIYAEILKRPEY